MLFRQPLKRQQGFTIVEVLVVLAIMSMILMLIFELLPKAKQVERDNFRKREVDLAAAQIEEFHNIFLRYPSNTNDQNDRCGFIKNFMKLQKPVTCRFGADGHDCTLGNLGPIGVCFEPDNVGHNYVSEDNVAIMFGHWCNRPPHYDGTTNPVMDLGDYPQHASNKYVVWIALEATGQFYCVDNSAGTKLDCEPRPCHYSASYIPNTRQLVFTTSSPL